MDICAKWDVNMLIDELIQGMDQAAQLTLHLCWGSGSESFQVQDLLLQRVMSSFENALLMLQWISLAKQSLPVVPPDSGLFESSSVSMNNGGGTTTPSDDSKQAFMNLTSSSSSKKRKTMETWTKQVKVSAEHGLEGPADDGYSWRKYGQKNILGAKFPRSYYKCTYRALRNCWATKQIQRSDELPTVFDITYKGFHTCNNSPPPPKQSNVNIINFQTNTMESNYSSNKDAGLSFSFPSSSWTCPENQFEQTSTIAEECLSGKDSASFCTPIMPQPNYYSAASWNHNLQNETIFLQQYESELTDIVSSDASATTTLQYSIDTPDLLDPNFLYDISDFLSSPTNQLVADPEIQGINGTLQS